MNSPGKEALLSPAIEMKQVEKYQSFGCEEKARRVYNSVYLSKKKTINLLINIYIKSNKFTDHNLMTLFSSNNKRIKHFRELRKYSMMERAQQHK